MTIVVLSLVILFQIGLFQFLAVLANRSIFQQELQLLGALAPDRLTNHARRPPVLQLGLGLILGCLVLLPLFGLPSDPVLGKLLLVSVSLISAIGFFFTRARDRAMMSLLIGYTPEGSVRRASLKCRSLRQWYHPAIEAIPIVIFVATLLFLTRVPEFIAADEPAFTAGRMYILTLYGFQGLLVFGAHFYALGKGVDVNSMATYLPSLRRQPEVALRLGEELAGTQVRFFMFMRIGVAALLGTTIVEKVFAAIGNPGVFLWQAIGWGLIGVLLISFFFYLRKVGRISRQMQKVTELSYHETASQG